MSFGNIKQKFEIYKYRILAGTVLIPFFYQLGDSLLIPMERSIDACSSPNLYGRYQPLFVGLNIVPITIFMVLIVVLYMVGGYIIWKKFLRIKSFEKCNDDSLLRRRDTGVVDITFTNKRPVNKKISGGNVKFSEDTVWHNSDEKSGSDTNFKEISVKNKILRTKSQSLDDNTGICSSYDVDISLYDKDNLENAIFSSKPQNELETLGCKKLKDGGNETCDQNGPNDRYASDTRRSTIIDQKSANKSWEVRAFFTCLIIAFQTVLLTGPIIYGFWIDVVTRNPVSVQFKFILSFPYLLAGLLNVFVYTWRFQEIRNEFRRLCRRQN